MSISSADLRELARNAAPATGAAILRELETPAAPVKVPRTLANGMNKLERDFSLQLDLCKLRGDIKWWAFNSIRLKLTGGKRSAYYKPDFAVITGSDEMVFYETKGFLREAANLRIKVAAGLFPCFRFIMVRRIKGEWIYDAFDGPETTEGMK